MLRQRKNLVEDMGSESQASLWHLSVTVPGKIWVVCGVDPEAPKMQELPPSFHWGLLLGLQHEVGATRACAAGVYSVRLQR